jgi:hypothetical protein
MPKKPRLNSSADTIDTVLESGCLVESVKVRYDFDCEFVNSRPFDPFYLALIFPLSQDVKPQLASSNEILDVRMVLPVSNTTNVSQTEHVSVIGPSADVLASCADVHASCATRNSNEQNPVSSQRDYSFILDDIADIADFYDEPQGVLDRGVDLDDGVLDIPEYVFPNPSPGIDCSDDFIPLVEDVDEALFTFESAVIPGDHNVANDNITNNKSSTECFRIAIAAELENVRRGGVRRSEASERWATRSFEDWRRIRGLSVEKTIGELSEEADLKPLTNMMVQFMLETKKQNGDLYHPNMLLILILVLFLYFYCSFCYTF